ncbi:MAG: hypothetical protein QNL62_07375 [Gammaproteobacteria bacterium]|nr:hypothetical protein [Gammaproteobacteria bacterium]
MASFKAIVVMLVFSAAVVFGMQEFGLSENFRDPAMALVGAVVLLVALIINVSIYLKVAGEAPFKWFKD